MLGTALTKGSPRGRMERGEGELVLTPNDLEPA